MFSGCIGALLVASWCTTDVVAFSTWSPGGLLISWLYLAGLLVTDCIYRLLELFGMQTRVVDYQSASPKAIGGRGFQLVSSSTKVRGMLPDGY